MRSLLAVAMLAGLRNPVPTPDDNGHAQAGGHQEVSAAVPGPQYTVKGIDVSSHDHSVYPAIDWAGQAAQGASFAHVKPTESGNYVKLRGEPVTFRSPLYGTTEIYARGTGNHLVQRYYSDSSWSARNDLGGPVDGDPAVFYNPQYRSTEIYATGAGSLRYTLVMPGGGWTPWTGIGGALDTDPVVLLNPWTGNTEIYAVSNGNLVTQLWLRGLSVWSGWSNIMQ
ncbi:hypothetical protein ACPPVO_09325 [Dactylosporangium sp. McL0621]|uniref:hypothetical protein n=1 Tax=Dactylosporangium sp. McL0621 TaxID=3415678 RepID=UPI003CF0DAF1